MQRIPASITSARREFLLNGLFSAEPPHDGNYTMPSGTSHYGRMLPQVLSMITSISNVRHLEVSPP